MAAAIRFAGGAGTVLAVLLVSGLAVASTLVATFTFTPPQVTRASGFTFGVAGDINYGSDPAGVMAKVKASNPAFFLAIGDLNYSTANDTNKESNWCSFMKSYVNNTEVLAGNHDDGQTAGDNITKIAQYCPFTLGKSNGTYSREYYFDFPQAAPLARFILTSCGLNFQAVDGFNNYFACQNKTTDAHYQFAKKAIDGAHSAHIPWVIVATHMHIVSQDNRTTYVSQDFANLLMYERVDLVLHGHVHDYQRTSQLTCFPEGVNNYNPACISRVSSPYKKGSGAVDVIVGSGGQGTDLTPNACPYLWWPACHGRMFGFLSVAITAASLSATFVWYRSVDGSAAYTDSFTIGG